MSMLAEPRKKQKYSLNPRGLDWANDENKFGQKLMERMGWKKGNGLGANEDGNQECIAVSAKHDSKGVGFTHQQSDNWLSHQDDFAAVLAQLHSQHTDSSSAAATAAAADDVSSLEEKSKSSRRRVHYKKFTQGKDLSNCQGEDLKCIFGRKKNKSNKSTREDVRDGSEQQQTSLQGDGPADSSENSFGVVTITSTSSIAEYFAKKMASLKKSSSAPSYLDQQGDDSGNASGTKGSGTDSVSDEEQPVRFCLGAEESGDSSTIDSKRKNKKSKKNKEEKEPQTKVLENRIDEQERLEGKRERKREREMQEEKEEREKKKNKQEKIEQIEDEDVIACEPERKKSKKSKSSKSASDNTDIVDVSGKCADALNEKSETIVEISDDKKIKKKKKNKSKVDVNNATNDSVIVCDEMSDSITSNDDVIRIDDDVVKIDDDDDNDMQNNESLKSDKKSKKRDKSKKKSKS